MIAGSLEASADKRHLIDIADVNPGAFAGEAARDRKPDAVGAGGYQHAQTLDVEIHDRSEMSDMSAGKTAARQE